MKPNIEAAVDYLTHYLETYTDQHYYRDYSLETFVQDVLYGLGRSIDKAQGVQDDDPKSYEFAPGFDRLRDDLSEYLKQEGKDWIRSEP